MDPASTSSPRPRRRSLKLCWYVDYNHFLYWGMFSLEIVWWGGVGTVLPVGRLSKIDIFGFCVIIIFLWCIGNSLIWCCAILHKYSHHGANLQPYAGSSRGFREKTENLRSCVTEDTLAISKYTNASWLCCRCRRPFDCMILERDEVDLG